MDIISSSEMYTITEMFCTTKTKCIRESQHTWRNNNLNEIETELILKRKYQWLLHTMPTLKHFHLLFCGVIFAISLHEIKTN